MDYLTMIYTYLTYNYVISISLLQGPNLVLLNKYKIYLWNYGFDKLSKKK